jgi:hypothetical protein
MSTLLRYLIVTAFLVVSATAQGKPPNGDSDVPATTIIDSSDTSFRIRDDGLGAYLNGVNSVESIIQGIGDWVMNSRNSSTRKVLIDCGDPVLAGDTSAPFSAALRLARFISKCAQLGFKIRDMQVGQTRECPLALAFDFNGINYRIAMNDGNFAATDQVEWTCLNSANGRCTSWMMEPAGEYDLVRKSKAQLIRVGTNRKNPDQPLGLFYFSFRVYVTTP